MCSPTALLDLAGNQLSMLPEDIFEGLDLLESLSLENNLLSKIPLVGGWTSFLKRSCATHHVSFVVR